MHLLSPFHNNVTVDISPPSKTPYSHQEMILRDYLAADRTTMANERLLLAYVRTALATIGAGIVLWHYQQGVWSLVSGGLMTISGAGIALIGLFRYRSTRKTLAYLRETSHVKALPREGE